MPTTLFDPNIEGKEDKVPALDEGSISWEEGNTNKYMSLRDTYRPDQLGLRAGRGAHSTRGGWMNELDGAWRGVVRNTQEKKESASSRCQLDLWGRRALRMSKHPNIPGRLGKGQLETQ